MKLLLSALSLMVSLTALSATCVYDYDHKASNLNWTAFKTPEKVGVKGQFSDFSIKATKGNSVDELLKSATFDVKTESVATNDKARDAKIFQFFFKSMAKGTNLTGKVTKVLKDSVEADFTINGVTKAVSLKKTVDEAKNSVNLSGTINVKDFGMEQNLSTLTKACNALHQGVTWPDVNVELVAGFSKTCK